MWVEGEPSKLVEGKQGVNSGKYAPPVPLNTFQRLGVVVVAVVTAV